MRLSAALEYEKLREDAASWNKVIFLASKPLTAKRTNCK